MRLWHPHVHTWCKDRKIGCNVTHNAPDREDTVCIAIPGQRLQKISFSFNSIGWPPGSTSSSGHTSSSRLWLLILGNSVGLMALLLLLYGLENCLLLPAVWDSAVRWWKMAVFCLYSGKQRPALYFPYWQADSSEFSSFIASRPNFPSIM